ncbi:MAG: S41 family peptidase [Bacteroidota bacterium]|nr:S41 family peptidase [Bacteroidota bacterium]
MRKLVILPILITLVFASIFTSCKKDQNTGSPTLSDAMARDTLYYLMNDWYYWYNLMPAVTKDNYKDPYALMDAMRYTTFDHWSFVADYNEFVSEMEGNFVGHGIRIGLDESQKARIAMIYSGSPLYASGVRRGWIVKSINGYNIAQIIHDGDATAYNTALGASTAGVTNTFVFTRPNGTDTTFSSTKKEFTVNSVLLYDTLHLSSGVTGHLVFESFIQPSHDELLTAFAYFRANNVKDLILDLRYNSGGYLYIAQELASYIAGNNVGTNSVFAKLSYNDKHTDQNVNYLFKTTPSPLDLPRMVVITTRLTASASEAVMNGLKPYLNLVTIGDTTTGKPVGMNGWAVGQKYFFWPVTFKMVNKNNEGDYFGGIIPDEEVFDDVTHDFADRRELCLKEAIHYLETGSTAKRAVSAFHRYPQMSEKPSWMTKGFTIVNK